MSECSKYYRWRMSADPSEVRPSRWLWDRVDSFGNEWLRDNMGIILNIPYHVPYHVACTGKYDETKWMPSDVQWAEFSSLRLER